MNKPTTTELIAFKEDKNINLELTKVFESQAPVWAYTGSEINFNDPYEAYMISELQIYANDELR